MTLDKDKRDGLVAAFKLDIDAHPDKKVCLVDIKEKIIPVLTGIYGKEETDPILKELEKHIKLKEDEEKVMITPKIETGDIYLSTQDFENIGATVSKDRLIIIEKYTNEHEIQVAVYLDQEHIDNNMSSQGWTLEEDAIRSYCSLYKSVNEHVEPVKNAPIRRMNQKHFMVALSKHL